LPLLLVQGAQQLVVLGLPVESVLLAVAVQVQVLALALAQVLASGSELACE